MGNKVRYYIDYSSIFPMTVAYDEKFVETSKKILANLGCKYFRMSRLHGWRNQPMVLCFQMPSNDPLMRVRDMAEIAIEQSVGKWPICIRPKNWSK